MGKFRFTEAQMLPSVVLAPWASVCVCINTEGESQGPFYILKYQTSIAAQLSFGVKSQQISNFSQFN